MADLKIPNLNNNSKQYLFKNKLPIAKKSRSKLIKESILMIITALIIFAIGYYIPSQDLLFNGFTGNLNNIYINFILLIKYSFQVILVLLIVLTKIAAGILLIGSLYRIQRVFKKKTSRSLFRE